MLRELGFDVAAAKVEKKLELKKKLTIAYEFYRVVTPAVLQRFQEQLKAKTLKPAEKDKHGYTVKYETYDYLKLIPISQYGEVPPQAVLDELKLAKSRGCFDSFEVAKVETFEVRPDPIIFGLINGCDEKFFIGQWDNDVKIEDILNADEG